MSILSFIHALLYLLVLRVSQVIHASERHIKLDSVVPRKFATADADFFTHSAFRALIGADQPTAFGVMKVGEAEFPALNDQGVSYAVLQFPSGSLNQPHLHPEAGELLFLLTGSLEVGFIDVNDVLRIQTLEAGDVFVFPKGLVHYQYNYGQESAFAISAFGDADARTVLSPWSVVSSNTGDDNIAKSFQIDASNVQKIKASLMS